MDQLLCASPFPHPLLVWSEHVQQEEKRVPKKSWIKKSKTKCEPPRSPHLKWPGSLSLHSLLFPAAGGPTKTTISGPEEFSNSERLEAFLEGGVDRSPPPRKVEGSNPRRARDLRGGRWDGDGGFGKRARSKYSLFSLCLVFFLIMFYVRRGGGGGRGG